MKSKPSTDLIRNIGSQILMNHKETKKVNLQEQQILEWIKCRNNPLYYIYNYVKFEITGGISSYKEGTHFHPKLKRLVRIIYKYNKAQLMATRQLGKSTISAAIISWAVTFFPRNDAIILNLKKDAALKNLKTIKYINEELPLFLKLDLHSKSDIKTYAQYSNGSIVTVYYPTTVHTKSTIARSLTAPILYIDEAAHIQDMGEVFGSAQPILSRARENAKKNKYPFMILVTTTPNGIEGDGGWFYDRWEKGVDSDLLFDKDNNWVPDADNVVNDPSKNGFAKIRYHWTEDPSKNEEWYKEQCREISDQRKINQELDLVFVGSSNCIFDDELLCQFKSKQIAEVVDCPHETKMVVYEKEFDPNDYYLIGVDTARSLSGAYNSIEIFSFLEFKQVAEFNYRLGSFTKYGEIIDFIFKWLNKKVKGNIILAIENNTIGLAPIEHLLEHCKDIPYRSYIYKEKNAKEYGISTTGVSKDLMIGCLTEILKENPKAISSQDLINQISSIERNRGGSISSTTFSDLFMASCFCAYVRKMKAIDILPNIKFGKVAVQNMYFDNMKAFVNLDLAPQNKEKTEFAKEYLVDEKEMDFIISQELEKRDNMFNKKSKDKIEEFFSPFI